MALPEWPRPHYRPGGGDALVYYMVFGDAPETFEVDGQKYRCAGVPPGMALDEYDRERQPAPFEMIDEPVFADALRLCGQDIVDAARAAQSCLLVHGTISDPSSLNYLRDAIGLVQYLLDTGAVAVLDLQTITWWAPDAWREKIFDPGRAVPRHHAVVLVSPDDEAEGRAWFHTRGMRKFGRPDISIHNVSREQESIAEDLCNRLIEHLANGAKVKEGQELTLAGLSAGIKCHQRGDMDDPDFNNVHIAIRFPE